MITKAFQNPPYNMIQVPANQQQPMQHPLFQTLICTKIVVYVSIVGFIDRLSHE